MFAAVDSGQGSRMDESLTTAEISAARRTRPVRALWTYHFPIFGGPHNLAAQVAGPLRAAGIETSVVITDEPGDAADRLRAADLVVDEIPLRRVRAVPDPREHAAFAMSLGPDIARLREVIREREIDVVILTGLVNPHAAIAARLEGRPVVWQIVDTRSPAPLRRASMYFVRELADSVMYNGQALAQLHAGHRGVHKPAFVFFQTADPEVFRPSPELRESVRERLGVPPDAPLVGTVANVNPQKGIDYFVRAAALIHRVRPDAWFLVWGAAYETHRDYRANLDDLARRAGLPLERLIFHHEPIAPPYPALDVKLITSVPRSEGTTTTAAEAMACEVPVVATDVGAVREVVEHGHTGLVVPPVQPNALASAALRILGDPGLAREFGRAGRERVLERYTPEVCAALHVRAIDAALADAPARRPVTAPPELVALLACTACRGPMSADGDWLECGDCGLRYPVVDGIPMCRMDDALRPSESEHVPDELKQRQQEFFDHETDPEYEIERPAGTPRLYEWLMREKFRRSIAGFEALVPGSTALCVCAGSGMDAEFLAETGAHVIAADLSLGAARRAQERAARHGVPLWPLVADAEALPFADHAVNVAYVHDGLHHLREPLNGVLEMARVASRAVSINEPVAAAVTRVAVALGIALEYEEAGNRVERCNPEELAHVLRRRGFDVFGADRYAMFYRHEPTRAMHVMSARGVLPLARSGFLAANALIGRGGNKLALRAARVVPDRRGSDQSAG